MEKKKSSAWRACRPWSWEGGSPATFRAADVAAFSPQERKLPAHTPLPRATDSVVITGVLQVELENKLQPRGGTGQVLRCTWVPKGKEQQT